MSFFENRFILGAVDEVTAAMEDNIMNLQSMVASQFIGPFLQAVQKLERALSLGVEIIDEWMVTQRKWCYLEGIFVGGDIRSQLPDEARKFDDIDKSFQRVNNFNENSNHYWASKRCYFVTDYVRM